MDVYRQTQRNQIQSRGKHEVKKMYLPVPVLTLSTQPTFSRELAVVAAQRLAEVDYSVATRVSEDVAAVIQFAYAHDAWWLSSLAIQLLQTFDTLGSYLIAAVVFIVTHAK